MKTIFADTFYWIALLNSKDGWFQEVNLTKRSLGSAKIVTTDKVLVELLTFYSAYGAETQQATVQLVRSLLNHSTVQVLQQTRESFFVGLELYAKRPAKEYSMTDCISMQVMRQLGITEVLMRDRHFTQEGFTILFNEVI